MDDGHFVLPLILPRPRPVFTEPAPTSSGVGVEATINTSYSFDRVAGTGTGTPVTRGGTFITLHHSSILPSDEGRGVHFFDLLAGQGAPIDGPGTARSNLNSRRVAYELNKHHFATGSFPIEVRPIALAIARGCFSISGTTVTSAPASPLNLPFFNARNGMTIDQLVNDTRERARTLPRRKADIEDSLWIERLILIGPMHRCPTPTPKGLLQQYLGTPTSTPDVSLARIRQEVFRRPMDV